MTKSTRYGTNSGHGHVWDRPDGVRMRCGGPGICDLCSLDAVEFREQVAAENDSPIDMFLEGLSALSKRHGVYIGGCGCCGSPFLYTEDQPKGRYIIGSDEDQLSWEADN